MLLMQLWGIFQFSNTKLASNNNHVSITVRIPKPVIFFFCLEFTILLRFQEKIQPSFEFWILMDSLGSYIPECKIGKDSEVGVPTAESTIFLWYVFEQESESQIISCLLILAYLPCSFWVPFFSIMPPVESQGNHRDHFICSIFLGIIVLCCLLSSLLKLSFHIYYPIFSLFTLEG